MNNLINRQTAINMLNDMYHGMISDESMKIYQIINFLNELPPAQRWISVSERVPAPGQWVIATYERTYSDTGVTRRLVVDTIYSARTGWNDTPDIKTVAWMPMPEPYAGGNA